MIVICTILALAFLITSAFQCHVRNWGLQYLAWSHRRHCIQAEISWSGYAIADVITDLALLLFPVPLVWKLQLTLSNKVSVLLVFLLGSVSTAVGIVRMVVILYFTYGTSWPSLGIPCPDINNLGTSYGYRDLLDTISTALIWSLVEASVAIVASCLPSIRPLIHQSSASRPASKPMELQLVVQPTLYELDDFDDRQSLTPRLEREHSM